jgi:hypothetical protein
LRASAGRLAFVPVISRVNDGAADSKDDGHPQQIDDVFPTSRQLAIAKEALNDVKAVIGNKRSSKGNLANEMTVTVGNKAV